LPRLNQAAAHRELMATERLGGGQGARQADAGKARSPQTTRGTLARTPVRKPGGDRHPAGGEDRGHAGGEDRGPAGGSEGRPAQQAGGKSSSAPPPPTEKPGNGAHGGEEHTAAGEGAADPTGNDFVMTDAGIWAPEREQARVECPHCNRKFNELAAKRHIPKCKDVAHKPKPPPRVAAGLRCRILP
jgi:hypothetical protein